MFLYQKKLQCFTYLNNTDNGYLPCILSSLTKWKIVIWKYKISYFSKKKKRNFNPWKVNIWCIVICFVTHLFLNNHIHHFNIFLAKMAFVLLFILQQCKYHVFNQQTVFIPFFINLVYFRIPYIILLFVYVFH